jgi:hypothetical protein
VRERVAMVLKEGAYEYPWNIEKWHAQFGKPHK